jgi:hypothetical protein
MIEKYESEQARSEHRKGAALAGPLADLQGKLSSNLDTQVLVPHRRATHRRAHCDRPPGYQVAIASLSTQAAYRGPGSLPGDVTGAARPPMGDRETVPRVIGTSHELIAHFDGTGGCVAGPRNTAVRSAS